MKYSRRYQITAAQIDSQYRLTIDGLLTFHENTVARYFTTLGIAAFDMQKLDKTWVISEINLELPQPPTMWSEDLDVTVWFSEITPLRAWIEFEVKEVHSGLLAARGNSCWSLISMSERKLVSCQGFIPESELVPEFADGPHRKRGIMKFADVPIASLEHTVNPIDLDFNGHTNNRRYIQMALISFASEFLQENRPDFLNIRFIRESLIGDRLTGFTYPTEDSQAFAGRILNGSGEEICRISSHWRPKEPLPDIAEVNLARNS